MFTSGPLAASRVEKQHEVLLGDLGDPLRFVPDKRFKPSTIWQRCLTARASTAGPARATTGGRANSMP